MRRRRRGVAGNCISANLRPEEVPLKCPYPGGEALAVSQTTRHAPGPSHSPQRGPMRVTTAGVGGSVQNMARRWLSIPFVARRRCDVALSGLLPFCVAVARRSWTECERAWILLHAEVRGSSGCCAYVLILVASSPGPISIPSPPTSTNPPGKT